MNRYLICMIFFLMLVLVSCAEDDEPEWNAAEVCPEAGTNRYGMPNRGTFIDVRDGREYKYTTIGDQVWMAENLKYDAPYSVCNVGETSLEKYCNLVEQNCASKENGLESWCERFGRYYSIIEDEEMFGFIDRNLIDTICPKGWHIPTKNEWEILEDALKVDGDDGYDVARRLSSSDSLVFKISENTLNHYNENRAGTDDCGMSLLPSGHWSTMRFEPYGIVYLTASQFSNNHIYVYYSLLDASLTSNNFSHKSSIRCLKD